MFDDADGVAPPCYRIGYGSTPCHKGGDVLNLSTYEAHRKKLRFAPELDACPRCGTVCPRHEVRTRPFWEANLQQPTITDLSFGCYLCPQCPKGERWFTSSPAPYRTRGQYSLPARRTVLDLVKRFKMPLLLAAEAGRKLLHLPKLNETTLLEWYRAAGESVDHQGHVEGLVSAFSGQMALDEVYDGGFCQLVATDPINNLQLDYEFVEGNAVEDDVRRFLERLKAAGYLPQLVVTDGSKLYPSVLKEVWPESEHQRCVFHFVKQAVHDIGKAFWKAYNTMPEPPKRKRGRPKKRGRPRKDKEKKENRAKVRRARYLICKREENLSEQERKTLKVALGLCPPLKELLRFARDLLDVFGPKTTSLATADAKRNAILASSDYEALEGIDPILKRLRDDDLFARLTRYLDFENAKKTSNHVERENRELRNQQKTRYRLRSLRSISALLKLLLTRKAAPDRPETLRRKPPGVERKPEEEVLAA